MQRCPEQELLHCFFDGQLTQAEFDEMELHVESCDTCQSVLATLVDQDPVEVHSDRRAHSNHSSTQLPARMSSRIANRLAKSNIVPALAQSNGHNALRTDSTTGVPKQIGDFRIEREIGRGGMGIVYEAEHVRLKRKVAVKLLNRPQDERLRARFYREMAVSGQLDHPNIVHATDAGERDGICFIAMELLDGIDVKRLATGPLLVADACEIIRQAAIGLHHAHHRKLIHRDIKPANLLVTTGGIVKILDMGLARIHQAQDLSEAAITNVGEVPGTPDYMSPEQCREPEQVSHKSDVYALGATLYHLLTGASLLAEHPTFVSKLTSLVSNPPPSIGQSHPELPQGLAELVDQMIQHDPDERIQSALIVADRLEPYCQGASLENLVVNRQRGLLQSSVPTSSQVQDQTSPDLRFQAESESKPKPSQRKAWYGNRVFHLLLAAVVVAVLFSVIYIEFGKSVLKIDVRDSNIRVQINGKNVTLNNRGERIRLTPGEHQLTVKRGDFEFQTKKFSLGRGEKEILIVEYMPGLIQVVRDGQIIDDRRLPEKKAAESAETPSKTPSKTSPRITKEPAGRESVVSNQADREFARWLKESGTRVALDVATREQLSKDPDRFNGSWDWKREWLKDDNTFVSAMTIDIPRTDFTQELIDRIETLPQLRCLQIKAPLPVDFLSRFDEIPSLNYLRMYCSEGGFTDDSISYLKKFPALRGLGLGRTECSDEGLSQLALIANEHLPNLKVLRCNIGHSDRGMKSISTIQTLEDVTFTLSERITDQGVSYLVNLPLKRLVLYSVPVTDKSMDHLAKMPGLVHISVQRTSVTAKGLLRLKSLPNLRHVDARDQPITRAELKELRAQMPNVIFRCTPK